MTIGDSERTGTLINLEPEPILTWLREVEQTWSNIPELDLSGSGLRHLVIICDGNRRAAEERGLEPVWGHRVGVETIKGIMKAGREWGIDNLTFWVWSTENWQRDKGQISFIMNLATRFINQQDFVDSFLKTQTRFIHLGRKDRLPNSLSQAIEALESNRSKNAAKHG